MRIVTLLTDYGLSDNFVGVLKGVILGVNPDAQIVDITHNVKPQDIMGAAFLLKGSYKYFPKGTIHLVVVDPCVGSKRRAIIVKTRDYIFAGPDNGVLSLALDSEKIEKIVEITNDKYFLKPVSSTFHGRDIFAPVVGQLSKGVHLERFGRGIGRYKKMVSSPYFLKFNFLADGNRDLTPFFSSTVGRIIYIDHFGNLITNIKKCSNLQFKRRTFNKISSSYADVKKGSPLAIFGGFGCLEIAVREGSAKDYFNAKIGDIVRVNR